MLCDAASTKIRSYYNISLCNIIMTHGGKKDFLIVHIKSIVLFVKPNSCLLFCNSVGTVECYPRGKVDHQVR